MSKLNYQPPESTTLFYPASAETLAAGAQLLGATAGILIIPFLLLIGIAAPLIVLRIPLTWICCKLHGVPFDLFDLEYTDQLLDHAQNIKKQNALKN